MRRQFPDHPAHLPHLRHVYDDRGDPDNVVLVRLQFAREVVSRRKVQHRTRRGYVGLDQHDSPRTMKHSQGKAALGARHLIVIKLHRIDGAAAELIVLRVGPENRAQQYARVRSFGMSCRISGRVITAGGWSLDRIDLQFSSSSFPPHAVNAMLVADDSFTTLPQQKTQKNYTNRTASRCFAIRWYRAA